MGDWNSGGNSWGTGGAATNFNTNDEWNSGSAGGATSWNEGGPTNDFNDGAAAPSGDFGGSGEGGDEASRAQGGCFNCGQDGHMKSDCPNPRIERPFDGKCRLCDQAGHMSKDCPTKPKFCKQCQMENSDHDTIDCKNKKVIDTSEVPEMSEKEAWSLIKEASDDLDVGDFKDAIKILSKAAPRMTYPEIERELRKRGMNIYLIALKKEAPAAYINTNLQGETGKAYQLGIFTKTFSCPRPVLMPIWPKDPAENLEHLDDCGVPLERGVPICSSCGELGHMRKACTAEISAPERVKITCVLCDKEGHRARDCTDERPQARPKRTCKFCESEDHIAKDCDQKPPQVCRNCQQEGHMSSDCTNERVMKCRNCDGLGHAARECPEAKDWSRHQCRHCGEKGHGSANRCAPGAAEKYAAAQAADAAAKGESNDFETGGAAGGDGGWTESNNNGGGSGQADWETNVTPGPAAVTAGGW